MKTIALWGPSASGKTVLLAQLYLRFQALSTNWRVFPVKETQEFIERMRGFMFERCEFPPPTAVRGDFDYERIAYEFEHKSTHDRVQLFTEDRAGQLSSELPEEELARFGSADGLVIMIDTLSRVKFQAELQRAIERFYHAARSGGAELDARPVAFCLAKADRLIRSLDDLHRAQQRPDEFVLSHLPEELVAWLRQFCPNHRMFPVSSVGVRQRLGVVEPAVFYDENMVLRLTNEGVPVNLATPFEWLFEQVKKPE